MKVFFITILSAFFTFFWSSGSVRPPKEVRNFCDLNKNLSEGDTENQEILSIFNLRKDLIIQMKDKLSSNTTFWRIYDTDIKPLDDINFDLKDPKNIAKRIKEKVYLSEDLYHDFQNLSFRGQPIDPDKPLMAHSIMEWQTHQIYKDCLPDESANQTTAATYQRVNKSCQAYLNTRFVMDSRLVCVYNAHVYVGKNLDIIYGVPALYTSMSEYEHSPSIHEALEEKRRPGGRLTNLEPELLELFQVICHLPHKTWSIWNNDAEDDSVSVRIWKLSEPDSEYPQNVIQWKYYKDYNVYWNAANYIHPDEIHYMFRFNSYYRLMTCKYPCTLDTSLLMSLTFVDYNATTKQKKLTETVQFQYLPILTTIHYLFSQKELTLRRMVGCEDKSSQFDPNYFCHPKRRFLSILSLGSDVYFQETGRFWRYNNFGFNYKKLDLRLNDMPSHFMAPIRLDSDVTAILENEDFDTSYPVTGFTFNRGFHDLCHGKDVYCNQVLSKTNEYFTACLYGISNEFRKDIKPEVSTTLYYTPAGLTRFRNKTLEWEMDLICSFVPIWLNHPMPTTSVTALQRDEQNISYLDFWAVIQIADQYYLKFTVVTIAPEMKFQTEKQKLLQTSEVKSTGFRVSVFKYLQKYWLYENGLLFSLIHYKDNNIDAEPPFGETLSLYDLLQCPFNSTTSLVSVEREEVCQRNKINSVESVFTIGEHQFHQLGQHFYKYNERNDSRFSYDKYVTDLFNDYFDTRHRVTGFSVARGKIGEASKHFEVLIHGKSNEMHRSLGEYIFAVFMFGENGIFPLSTRNYLFYQYFKNCSIGQNVNPEYNDFIKAFGTSKDPQNATILVWIGSKRVNNNSLPELVATTDPDRFAFMFTKTIALESKKGWITSISRFGSLLSPLEIIGIHGVLTNHQKRIVGENLLLLYGRKAGQPIKVYAISKPVKSNELFKDSISDVYELKRNVFYNDLFCAKTAVSAKSDSSDSESAFKTLNSIFAFLLLVLLSLVLVIAFCSYRRNERIFELKYKCMATASQQMRPNNEILKKSESHSVGQEFNQTVAKTEESPSKNLDISSKASMT